MIDTGKLHKYIIKDAARNMGWEEGEDFQPYLEEIAGMTPVQVFDRYCNWNGFIGYGNELFSIVKELQEAAQGD